MASNAPYYGMNPDVITSIIELLELEFGKEAPLTKTRGKVREYLGMITVPEVR